MFIKLDEKGNVVTIIYNTTPKYNELYYSNAGFIKCDIPEKPQHKKDEIAILKYNDGKCYWSIEKNEEYKEDIKGGDEIELEKDNADLLLELVKKDEEIIKLKNQNEELEEQISELLLQSVGGEL